MKATMFVPTGLVLDGHPFFSDWARLGKFAATGRWDLQAHGHRAHDLIEISPDGAEGSFLVNRKWLPAEARLEIEPEFLARVEGDYHQVKREIEARIAGATIVGYAFPFSEAGQETAGNLPDASKVNERFLSSSYRFGFIQDANGYNEIGASPPLFLKRYSVPRDLHGPGLVRRLSREHPRARALSELARFEMWAGLYGRSRDTWETLVRENPSLADDASFFLATIDYQRGGLRAARRNLETAKRANTGVQPDAVLKLERRIAWDESFRVQPRFDFFEDSEGRRNQTLGLAFALGSFAPLELRGALGGSIFEEESFEPFEALEGEIGMSLRASRVRFDARLRQREAASSGPDSTNYGAAFDFEDDRAEFHLRAGLDDVDTLRAKLQAIDVRSVQLQQSLHLGPRFSVSVDGRYGRYSDSNERADFVGRLSFRPWQTSEWRLGASFGYTDTLLQSDAYYTPEDLRFARGLLAYAKAFPSGWSVDSSVELGWARDSLRGDRFTAYARGQAISAWSSRFRTSVGWSLSSAPGYRSWSVVLGLHYGFTGGVPSSLTAQ
jgi:hypothetical protein